MPVISDLSIQDAPKAKSKNLDVVSEFKKSNLKSTASFVVVGKWRNKPSNELLSILTLRSRTCGPR